MTGNLRIFFLKQLAISVCRIHINSAKTQHKSVLSQLADWEELAKVSQHKK